jgi:hypothetical protein
MTPVITLFQIMPGEDDQPVDRDGLWPVQHACVPGPHLGHVGVGGEVTGLL